MSRPSTSDGLDSRSATPPPIPRRSSARDRAQSFNFSYPQRFAAPKAPPPPLPKPRFWLQDSDADSSSTSVVSSTLTTDSDETTRSDLSYPSSVLPPSPLRINRVRQSEESSRNDPPVPPPSIQPALTNKSSSSLSRIFKPRTQDSLSIERRVSVDQQSERISLEDNSSSTSSSQSSNAEWKSSTFDTSNMTAAELEKCRKKGINPALYAEMRAARKGKGKWISPLVGNTFLG
ncbi:hypothetical protein W97_02003 [Coniosporium apollinis CBS 100218]|uniref:Uncharacterized protein n=1 Tax=Coniosporium apollinis (strain CBS 100218) TaxID=1168221 RepID=R7YLM6_CONA1|nr:uncharacterized protein W97_02003 [Coniosporium apollinis CBS 100218]EON62778.1 hypothetical protein W97_02003 [Coniosporium apollinis CBS 100218]